MGRMRYWSNGIMGGSTKAISDWNTPVLQYSNNPVGFHLLEWWSIGKNGVLE